MRVPVLLLVGAVLAGAIPASAHAGALTEPKRRGSVRDVGPTGSDPADANQLTAWRTTCATARRVARRSTEALARAIARSPDGVVDGYRVDAWYCVLRPKRVTTCNPRDGRRKEVRWRLGR